MIHSGSLYLDLLRHTGTLFRMACWLRKSAALLAVYAIALQALLAPFLPANHFSIGFRWAEGQCDQDARH
jgi:hypothetical protein